MEQARDGRSAWTFERTEVWIFDLDNTLYPAECNLFAQVDQRMGEFIARYLGVPFEYARHLQKSYYRQFGTTLTGLMQVHRMDPQAFLDYVHDLDLSGLAEHPRAGRGHRAAAGAQAHLHQRLARPRRAGRREARGAGPVRGHLRHRRSGLCAQATPACYELFLKAHGVDAGEAAMFEDMPHNLEAPHALGMTTVLVRSDANHDHPVQKEIRGWMAPPAHVHHMTYDLAEFLESVGGQAPSRRRCVTRRRRRGV